MSTLFVLLFLVSLIALAIGLAKPSWVKQSSRKRVGVIFGGAVLVFLILIGIYAPQVSAPAAATTLQATTNIPSSATSSQATATSTDDDISTVADQVAAQAALAKAPSVSASPPSGTKAGTSRLYPSPSLTPGAVLSTEASKICVSGYSSTVRNVSAATKKQVYAEYGVSYPQATGAYEVDHFIPLEIGGSNDIKNLWLEPASPSPGFHQKDQFEDFEHDQVCSGKISVQEAQSRMVSDWYFYYEEEVEGVTPSTATPSSQAAPVMTPQITTQTAPVQSPTPTASSAAYYTSSYYSSKYYYPASCTAWKTLSTKYLVSFDSLAALLAKYPDRTIDPGC
jgi:hypothetical protein